MEEWHEKEVITVLYLEEMKSKIIPYIENTVHKNKRVT